MIIGKLVDEIFEVFGPLCDRVIVSETPGDKGGIRTIVVGSKRMKGEETSLSIVIGGFRKNSSIRA